MRTRILQIVQVFATIARMDRRRTDTRDRMIDAAVALYRERGVRGTGFSDVLEASGAARGAIYHHFPGGKDELAAAVVTKNGADVTFFFRMLLEQLPPGDAIGKFARWYARELDRTGMTFGCPIAATVLELGLTSDRVAEAGAAAFDAWRDVIRRALEAAGADREAADGLAVTTVAALEGALLLCRAHRSSRPLTEVAAQVAAMLDRVVTEDPG